MEIFSFSPCFLTFGVLLLSRDHTDLLTNADVQPASHPVGIHSTDETKVMVDQKRKAERLK